MTDYYQRFVIPDIVVMKTLFLHSIRKAQAKGLTSVANFMKVILVEMEDDLVQLSLRTVEIADEAIRSRIESTAKRAVSTKANGLIDHIHSEPIIADAGIVGIAQIDGAGGLDELPYWRAQEYGLDEGFVGRLLFGFFYDFGGTNPTEPQSGIDTQPYFLFDPEGGAGRIQHPIEERKFLADGTNKAAVYWKREQRRIMNRAASRLRAIFPR